MKKLAGAVFLTLCSFWLPGCMEKVSANECSTDGIITAIKLLSNGGTADFSTCGSMNLTGPIEVGASNVPITLLLGTGIITFANTTGNGFQIEGNGSRILGQGPLQTLIMPNAGFSGDVIHVAPERDLTTNGLEGIELANFECDVTNAPTAICVNGVAVRHGSTFHNLRLTNMSGPALELITSSLEGGRISNITSVRDTYIQTAATALTGDTVILRGNAIQFDSNNTIYTPAPKGSFRGLVVSPSTTTQGDGRGNNIAHSVIEGYGTCLSIESPAGPNAGAIGSTITANWFEQCALAYQFTGADGSHMAAANQAFSNYFAPTVNKIAKLDFAENNFIQETTNGNAGTITLTNNSSNNALFVRLGNPNDISDFGSGNSVYSTLGKSAFINGDLHVGGNLYKSAGSFRIDHPLDPKHKYLQHSFVESPDMMDIYNGVVTLSEAGDTIVQLPDYFEALNSDFRYQLTPLGGFAPLYISREIEDGRFAIAGGQAGQKISWQVTGIRHDDYSNKHRIAVVAEKPQSDK